MQVDPNELPPRPGPAAATLGAARVLGLLALLTAGTAVLLGATLLPARAGRQRPAERVAVALCRAFLAIAGVRLDAPGREALASHRGFVFFNHVSWLDPIALVAAAPLRFLSTQGVRRLPFVGWMAAALGTIFVHRGEADSREAARQCLASAVAAASTPVALAPEGQIGPGPGVLPFRHGAFEVAADAGADVLLVALQFEPRAYSLWADDEWLIWPLWRLCARTVPVVARVRPLFPLLDREGLPGERAADAEARLAEALGARPRLPAR